MFWTKTVDSVVADFREAVSDLKEISKKRHAEIIELEAQVRYCRSEVTRADKIAAKIDQLISDE